MKKLVALVLTLICLLSITACNNGKQEQVSTYSCSFRGENEYFSISNGGILLNAKEEVFEGGNLEVVQSDLFAEIVSFSTTFYTMRNGEKHIIMSNSVVDQTGGSVNINGGLGRISGEGIIGSKVENIDDLRENLWFELKTTDSNNKETIYQIQLVLTE